MKKRIITLLTAASLTASAIPAFAADTAPVSESVAQASQQTEPVFIKVAGPVTEIEENIYTIGGPDMQDVNLAVVSENTLIYKAVKEDDGDYDIERVNTIDKGDSITAYTVATKPMVLSLPPRYNADIIVIGDINTDADIYTKSGDNWVNSANTLELIDEDDAEDVNGNDVKIKDGDKLLVFYTSSTRSIPAQTDPEEIIVLPEDIDATAAKKPEATEAPAETEPPAPLQTQDLAGISEIAAGDERIAYVPVKIGDNYMLPLRAIAEGLDFDIEWDSELWQIMINGGVYAISIGKDEYIKGRMAPESLGQAPVVINMGEADLTYVPVSFFTDILECSVSAEGDTLTIR